MASVVHPVFDEEELIDGAAADKDDDDEEVKDNWDDESEDEEAKKSIAPAPAAAAASSKDAVKKKSAAQKAKDKEDEKRRLEEETRLKIEAMSLTPEEAATRKAQIRKQQEDSDFAMFADTVLTEPSVAVSNSVSSGLGVIDAFEPDSAEGFIRFREILTNKIKNYEKSQFYPLFLQNFFQDLALNLNSEDVRKCGAILTTLAAEKAKKEKEVASKSKPKAKGKLAVKVTKKDDSMDTYNDYDDGMDDLL